MERAWDAFNRGVANLKLLRDIPVYAALRAGQEAGRAVGVEGPGLADMMADAIRSTAASQKSRPQNPAIEEAGKAFEEAPGVLPGIAAGGGVLARNPGAVAELLIELAPGAVVGGGLGGRALSGLVKSRLPAGIASKAAPYLTGAGIGAGAEIGLGLPSEVSNRVNEGESVDEAVRKAAIRTAASAPVAGAFGAALPFRPFGAGVGRKAAPRFAGNVLAQMGIQGAGEIATEEAGARALGERTTGGDRFIAFTIGALMAPLDMEVLSALRKATRLPENATDEDIRDAAINEVADGGERAQEIRRIIESAGADPDSFSDPEAIAQRIQQARARRQVPREELEQIPEGASDVEIRDIRKRNEARVRRAEKERERQQKEADAIELGDTDPRASAAAGPEDARPMAAEEQAELEERYYQEYLSLGDPDSPAWQATAREWAAESARRAAEQRMRSAEPDAGQPDFTAQPEGIMENTPGNRAGLDRYRQFQKEQLRNMRRAAVDDPLVQDILDSNIPVEDKIRAYGVLTGEISPTGPMPSGARGLSPDKARAARGAAQPSNQATDTGPLTAARREEMRRAEREAARAREQQAQDARERMREAAAEAEVEDLIRRFRARERAEAAERARRAEEERRSREQAGGRSQGAGQQQGPRPESRYGGSDSAPEQNADRTWRTTDDGEYVAGKSGKPAVWKDLRELAKWLVKNRLAGDFEPATWGSDGYVAKRNPRKQAGGTDSGGPGPDAPPPPPGDDTPPPPPPPPPPPGGGGSGVGNRPETGQTDSGGPQSSREPPQRSGPSPQPEQEAPKARPSTAEGQDAGTGPTRGDANDTGGTSGRGEPEAGGRGNRPEDANRPPENDRADAERSESQSEEATEKVAVGQKGFWRSLIEMWRDNFENLRWNPAFNDPEIVRIFKEKGEDERLRAMLSYIAEKSNNPFYRVLAKRLLDIVGNLPIPVRGDEKEAGVKGLTRKQAGFNADGRPAVAFVIELNTAGGVGGLSVETVLHETIHAVIGLKLGSLESFRRGLRKSGELTKAEAAAIDNLENVLKRLQALVQKLQADARKNPQFMDAAGAVSEIINIATTDIEEVIAHVMTNPAFQALLNSMDLDGNVIPSAVDRTRNGSIWNRFVEAVSGVLFPGKKPTDKIRTALDEVLDAANAAFRIVSDIDENRAGRLRFAGINRRLGKTSFSKGPPDIDRRINAVLDAIVDRESVDRLGKLMKGDGRTSVASVLGALVDRVSYGIGVLTFSNDARLRALARELKSDAIREIADMFSDVPGSDRRVGETYHEAVSRTSRTNLNAMSDILGDRVNDEAFLEKVRDALVAEKGAAADPEVKDIADRLKALLRDIHKYRREAGEDIGLVDSYFPRVLNLEEVVRRAAEFKKAAEKVYRRMGVEDPAGAAERWFQMIVREHAGVDGGLLAIRTPRTPASASARSRELFKAADAILADFYEKDAFKVLSSYIIGSARRAEYTRRFGMKGEEGSKERRQWQQKHGNLTQLEVFQDRIAEDLLAADIPAEKSRDALGFVDKIIRSNLGLLGTDVSHATSEAVSLLHVWNQVGKLDRAVMANLLDLAQGFVRTGSVAQGLRAVLNGMMEFARNLRGLPESEWKRYARAIGTVVVDTFEQNLQARLSAENLSEAGQRISRKFYKATLQTQLNEAARTAATRAGARFIRELVDDLNESGTTAKRAARYLRELGVSDVDAFAKWVRSQDIGSKAPPKAHDPFRMAKEEEEFVKAVFRFANDVALAPSRVQRPVYASHPVGSLFYGLMSFLYAFKSRILNRWGRLAKGAMQERDPMMLAPVAVGLPALLMASKVVLESRMALFGTNRDEEEDPLTEMVRLLDYSGLLAAASPLVNAIFSVRYQRSVLESLSGSVVGSLSEGARKAAGLFVNNSPDTNTAERAAAGALYDLIVEPAMDALAVSYLRAPVAAPIVVASGTKKGGNLPSDREAFIEALAGPEKKPRMDLRPKV
jgi:hypothetical protein